MQIEIKNNEIDSSHNTPYHNYNSDDIINLNQKEEMISLKEKNEIKGIYEIFKNFL